MLVCALFCVDCCSSYCVLVVDVGCSLLCLLGVLFVYRVLRVIVRSCVLFAVGARCVFVLRCVIRFFFCCVSIVGWLLVCASRWLVCVEFCRVLLCIGTSCLIFISYSCLLCIVGGCAVFLVVCPLFAVWCVFCGGVYCVLLFVGFVLHCVC